jgi:hypothetical protein
VKNEEVLLRDRERNCFLKHVSEGKDNREGQK